MLNPLPSFVKLEMKLIVLYMLGKCSTAGLYSQPKVIKIVSIFDVFHIKIEISEFLYKLNDLLSL